jgi:hypothetical protein
VFVGCPWKTVRPKYERIIKELKRKYPLAFVIVGRDLAQGAEDLLEVIKRKLLSSSWAIFDASGGNANVSLEFGFAEAHGIPRALYISAHKASKRRSDQSPIISDLVGKKRNIYRSEKSLKSLLSSFAKMHPYSKHYEQYVSKHFRDLAPGNKKRYRTLTLKIIHCFDSEERATPNQLVQSILDPKQKYDEREIRRMISLLRKSKLLTSEKGSHSPVRVALLQR